MLLKLLDIVVPDLAGKRALSSPVMPCLLFCLVAFSTAVQAADNIATPGDTNSWVIVENAIVRRNETTVFFLTRPDIRDPEARNPCALNYYTVTLEPGLPSAKPALVAGGVCGGTAQKSRLLDNGDVLVIVRDRLERWRGGKQVSSQKFSDIAAVSKLGVTTDMENVQRYDIAPSGELLLAVHSGAGNSPDSRESSPIIAALKADGKRRWQVRLGQPGAVSILREVWAGLNGSALLHTDYRKTHLSLSEEARLHFITAAGVEKRIVLVEPVAGLDPGDMGELSQEDLQKYFLQLQQQPVPETIEKLDAVARDDGGFEVLFHRTGGIEGRRGFFLYRIGPNGNVQSRLSLGKQIGMHGLDRWFDFAIEGKQLILLSKAPVTQKVVGNVKRKWGQNIVSWVDLDTGIPAPHLIPLDERYLEAAMNAGDEGQQYLKGKPGGEPVLLSKLGPKLLVVSLSWISKRQVVRLHEADPTLKAFTEVMDERQAQLAKDASRQQRAAYRDAQTTRMRAAEVAASGMSEEEYSALSSREQKEAILRNGGQEQLMQSMMEEAQSVQNPQSTAGKPAPQDQRATKPQDATAQVAAAMAMAQQQIASDPNISPAMRAQLEALMGQLPGSAPPAVPGARSAATAQQGPGGHAALPHKVLQVDSNQSGFIEYENPDGRSMTLLIFDRQSGAELLKKDYPGGVIYEYIDFKQFKRPLGQVGVIYREVSGLVVKDLTPTVLQ